MSEGNGNGNGNGYVSIAGVKIPSKAVAAAFEKGSLFIFCGVLLWAQFHVVPEQFERMEQRNDKRFDELNRRADARAEIWISGFKESMQRDKQLIEQLLQQKNVALRQTSTGMIAQKREDGEVIWKEN